MKQSDKILYLLPTVKHEVLTWAMFNHLSDENYDMIVAWDDNLRKENHPISNLKNCHLIFCVKRFLKEGIVQLY